MNERKIIELMHAVLDGEAASGEIRELETLCAADPAVRAQFEELRRLFAGLAGIPKVFPPEGLVAAVMDRIPDGSARFERDGQLFARPRVIGQSSPEVRDPIPGRLASVHRFSRPWPFSRELNMSRGMIGSSGKRKILVGVGIAAAIVAISVAVDFPPSGKDAVGTIVPVQRYRATQNTADDVKPATASSAQSIQVSSEAGNAANSAANAAANNAANAAANNAANGAANSAANAAANNAANAAANNAANAAANSAANAAANNAANAAANNAANAAANNAANAAANNAANAAANNAASRAVSNAVNGAANASMPK